MNYHKCRLFLVVRKKNTNVCHGSSCYLNIILLSIYVVYVMYNIVEPHCRGIHNSVMDKSGQDSTGFEAVCFWLQSSGFYDFLPSFPMKWNHSERIGNVFGFKLCVFLQHVLCTNCLLAYSTDFLTNTHPPTEVWKTAGELCLMLETLPRLRSTVGDRKGRVHSLHALEPPSQPSSQCVEGLRLKWPWMGDSSADFHSGHDGHLTLWTVFVLVNLQSSLIRKLWSRECSSRLESKAQFRARGGKEGRKQRDLGPVCVVRMFTKRMYFYIDYAIETVKHYNELVLLKARITRYKGETGLMRRVPKENKNLWKYAWYL